MKLCLIGSTRFIDAFAEANRRLTLAGNAVYSVASITTGAGSEVNEDQKIILDLVHLQKIQESEAVVLVTDENGYFGFSTRREMIWARILNKPILVYLPKYKGGLGAYYSKSPLDLPEPDKIREMWQMAEEHSLGIQLGSSEVGEA
jgi:hypothetical protein